jgi:hypothetical protein
MLTRWGMSRDEVRRLYPTAKDNTAEDQIPSMLADTEHEGLPWTAHFVFEDERLVLVRFHPRAGAFKSGEEEAEAFERLADSLSRQYGPTPRRGVPFSPGKLMTWVAKESSIALVYLSQPLYGGRLMLSYRPAEPAGEGAKQPAKH